ncbi:MAG: hypothetical protein ACRC4W_07645 [Treponemataceae bacterium]
MNSNVGLEVFVDSFSKSFNSSFSVDTVQKELSDIKIKAKKDDIICALNNNPQILNLNENLFINKIVFFENYFFSILPTKYEITNNIMIIGHRCVPFADFDKLPHEIEFFFENEKLQKKTVQMQTSFVFDYYSLFGSEYIPQYLEADIANTNICVSDDDFALPSKVNLTVIDMTEVYKKFNFAFGDRFLCRIFDRLEVSVSLEVTKNSASNPFEKNPFGQKQEKWYAAFEKHLQKVLKYYGPCSSIDEQLMLLFFRGKTELSKKTSGSIEEFLKNSPEFGFEFFGVEQRIWFKDEQIPLVGSWNKTLFFVKNKKVNFNFVFGNPLTENVIRAFILDSFFLKETDKFSVLDRIIPKKSFFSESNICDLLLFFELEYASLKKNYNRFADFEIGKLRNKILELYIKVFSFICDLANASFRLTSLPSQQIVILSQLFAHINQILESLTQSTSVTDEDMQSFEISIEGMELSFQDIYEDLLERIDEIQASKFLIVKKGDV